MEDGASGCKLRNGFLGDHVVAIQKIGSGMLLFVRHSDIITAVWHSSSARGGGEGRARQNLGQCTRKSPPVQKVWVNYVLRCWRIFMVYIPFSPVPFYLGEMVYLPWKKKNKTQRNLFQRALQPCEVSMEFLWGFCHVGLFWLRVLFHLNTTVAFLVDVCFTYFSFMASSWCGVVVFCQLLTLRSKDSVFMSVKGISTG